MLLAKGYYAESSDAVFNPDGFDKDKYIDICETSIFLSLHMSIPFRSYVSGNVTTTLDPIDRYGTAVNQNSNTNSVRFIFGTSSVRHARLYPDITVSCHHSRTPNVTVYAVDRLPKDYTTYAETVSVYSPSAGDIITNVKRYNITNTAASNTLCSAKGTFGLAGHKDCTITLYYMSRQYI